MQIYKDGKVGYYQEVFPNTSFPVTGPDDNFLSQRNAYKVAISKEYDFATQKLISCAPYVENGWAYTVAVVDKTPEDIAIDTANKASQMRAQRNQLLAETDWRFRSDMNPSQAWIDYCQALRDLTNQPGFPWDVQWPTQPE